AELAGMAKTPPPADELKAIQRFMVGSFTLQVATRFGLLQWLDQIDFHGLPADTMDTYVEKVMAVTPADVQRVVKKNLDPAHMTIVVVGDDKVVRPQLKPVGKISK